jgi:hypothetical protein
VKVAPADRPVLAEPTFKKDTTKEFLTGTRLRAGMAAEAALAPDIAARVAL